MNYINLKLMFIYFYVYLFLCLLMVLCVDILGNEGLAASGC